MCQPVSLQCETSVHPKEYYAHRILLVKKSQDSFFYIAGKHKFASKGFTICTTCDTLYPKTLFRLGKSP